MRKQDGLVTVRVERRALRRVMRARGIERASELVARLLEEEEERLDSRAALRATAGTARASDFDRRLL